MTTPRRHDTQQFNDSLLSTVKTEEQKKDIARRSKHGDCEFCECLKEHRYYLHGGALALERVQTWKEKAI